MNNPIVAIDLFCGAGGLTRGMLDAGVDVIGGFDIATDAQYAYEHNNIRSNGQSCRYFNQDVSTLTSEQISKLVGSRRNKTLLMAGCAPCQPFSAQNRNKRRQDIRRNLLLQFARLIRECKPDLVFMENVPGLPALAPQVFNQFLESLKETGLKNIDYGVVNAKDYGVPQNRRRFVLLASAQSSVSIPSPLYAPDKYKTVKEAISSFPAIQAGQSNDSFPNHRCAGLSETNLLRLKFIKHNRKELPPNLILECHKSNTSHSDTYGRMSWNKPAPTLTTKFFSISNGRYAHPQQNRAISLREGAALQSFPDNYTFAGSMQSIARQIGNAVPPLLAKHIIKTLLSASGD